MRPQRKSWMITHGASGGFLTYELIKSVPDLSCLDECHYTCDSAIVYTYLHFTSPVSPRAIHSFMARMKEEQQVIPFEIFGYDSIAANSDEGELVDHIGFKVLLHHYTTSNPSFKSCTLGKPGVIRGLLWQSDFHSRLREMADHRGMGLFFKGLENELVEYRKKAGLVELMQDQLRDYEARAQERDRYRFVYHVLKIRIMELDKATQEKLLAPDYKGRPLF